MQTPSDDSDSPKPEHDPYQALRVPGYAPYISGGVLASVGLEIQATAIAWEIYVRTGSYQDLGFVYLTQFLPVLLFALPAGQAADHFHRRKMYQCAQAIAALASLGLAWLSYTQGPIGLIYVCLFVSGTGRAWTAPARSALVSQIVPLTMLPNAVTWNSTAWQLANISGPALGGLTLAVTSHIAIAYLLAAGCALACIGLLFRVHPHRPLSAGVPRTLANLLAGIRFVWKSDLLLAAISLDLFAVLLGGATALLPAYARDLLHLQELGFGLLRSAPAMGAVAMALTLAHRPPMRRPGIALLAAAAGFGVAIIIFGISTYAPLSFVMLFLTGAFDNVSVVVRGTLMQVLTPDVMRGRVSAVNSIFIASSNELGGFESNQVAAWFGPVISVVSGGIGTIVIVALTAFLAPRLIRLGPLHELKADES